MFEVADAAGIVAVEWDARARKIERATVAICDYFHRIGIIDIVWWAWRLHGPDVVSGILHQLDESIHVIGVGERLVTLNIDIDVSGNALRDFMNAVGAALVCGG